MDYCKLLNKNVIKIIEALSKGSLYFNQISELTGIKSKNNLLKNLSLMVKLNILIREKNKSNTFYSINYNNRFSLTLLELKNMNKFQNLPFERRKALTEVINFIKPLIAVVFGSTAKGNFKKGSDIDILLACHPKIKDINGKVHEIGSRYGVKINAIIVNFFEVNINDATIKHILKTGYPIAGYEYFYSMLKNV